MREFIKTLLEETNFRVIEENNFEEKAIFFAESELKSTFYIIDFYNNMDSFIKDFESNQAVYYDYILTKNNSNELKKNTSLIVFLKLDTVDEANSIKGKVLELEESEYFFKKYVLVYTDEELQNIKEKTKYTKIVNYIKETIDDTEYFEDYKCKNIPSSYSLILKLFIKFPHLTYSSMSKRTDLMNLDKMITDDLNEQNLLDYHKSVINLKEDLIDHYIENIISAELEG